MIKTTRSRLELRQEPEKTASLVGALLVGVGGVEALLAAAALVAEWALPVGRGYLVPAIRLALATGFAVSGWIFLRGRSRVVIDLDHRMVARYLGVGGGAVGGNRSWDLDEFAAVVLVRRERRRMLTGFSSRSEVVCLRRPDGSDLEIYWAARGEGGEIAASVSGFASLPNLGGGAS